MIWIRPLVTCKLNYTCYANILWELLGAPSKIAGALSNFLEFPKYPLTFPRKDFLPHVTTVEEPSSVRSHGRTSSAGSHGRRFFRSCKLQLRKNLLPRVNLFFWFLNFWIILYLLMLFYILYFTITKFSAYLIQDIITK